MIHINQIPTSKVVWYDVSFSLQRDRSRSLCVPETHSQFYKQTLAITRNSFQHENNVLVNFPRCVGFKINVMNICRLHQTSPWMLFHRNNLHFGSVKRLDPASPAVFILQAGIIQNEPGSKLVRQMSPQKPGEGSERAVFHRIFHLTVLQPLQRKCIYSSDIQNTFMFA